jgi:hypothetical protein
MNGDDIKKKVGAAAVRGHLEQTDLRDALRSRYKSVARDVRFEELLKRLEQIEQIRQK